MSGRRVAVDLGPLALSLLDVGAPPVAVDPGARKEDAARLRSLTEARSGSAGDGAGLLAADDATDQGRNFGSIAGRLAISHDLTGCTAPDETNVELLAFELSAALQALRSAQPRHVGAAAEVMLHLRPTVLRDARLGVVESDGRLEFSLWVGNDDDCQWLARQLPSLSRSLGDRLRTRLRLRVFDGTGQHLVAGHDWPPEETR